MLSEEKVQDSSEDESSGSSESARAFKAKSSDSGKSSAIDSLIGGMSSDESDASDSSSTSTTSSTSAASKRKAVGKPKTTSDPPAKKAKTNLAKVKRVESATYVPPQGYTANKMQSSEVSSQAQSVFKDLDGKQIWQISAPASFPISKLESLNVQAALNGELLFQHKGISYTMTRGDAGETALLTPKPNGDYVRTATIGRVFNIRGTSDTTRGVTDGTTNDIELSQSTQHKNSAATSSESNVFFAKQTGQRKPPRQQPANLKARYVPYGVVTTAAPTENEDTQDGDMAMTDVFPEPAKQIQTNSQTTPKSSKKSKTTKASSPQVLVKETLSKRKKEKVAVSSSQGELAGSESSQKKRKEKSKK